MTGSGAAELSFFLLGFGWLAAMLAWALDFEKSRRARIDSRINSRPSWLCAKAYLAT